MRSTHASLLACDFALRFALRDQLAEVFARFGGEFWRCIGVGTQRAEFFFPVKVVSQPPPLARGERDEQKKASLVKQFDGLCFGFGGTHRNVGQRNGVSLMEITRFGGNCFGASKLPPCYPRITKKSLKTPHLGGFFILL